jgi:hypothetical protein
MSALQPTELEHGDIATAFVGSRELAEILRLLVEDCEHVLIFAYWEKGIGRKARVAVGDSQTALWSMDATGIAELALPDPTSLARLDLQIFYRDGSILITRFDTQNNYYIARSGEQNTAKARLESVADFLRSRRRKFLVATLLSFAALVVWTTLFVLFGLDDYTRPLPKPDARGNTTEVTLAGIALLLAPWALALIVLGPINTRALPRRHRLRDAWTWFQFSREDLRRLVITLASGGLIFVLGLLIGRR